MSLREKITARFRAFMTEYDDDCGVPEVEADAIIAAMSECISPLEWYRAGDHHYSRGWDYCVSTDGSGWAKHHRDFPPFGGQPHESEDAAKAAANAHYRAHIMASFDVEGGS